MFKNQSNYKHRILTLYQDKILMFITNCKLIQRNFRKEYKIQTILMQKLN